MEAGQKPRQLAMDGGTAPIADEGLDALPIHLLDLGKAKPKDVKALRRGGGKLHAKVLKALEDIEFNLGEEAAGKTILPVVLVVEKKRKRRSALPLQLF
jgi:hypothetical protein